MQHCCSEARARYPENSESVPPEAETTLLFRSASLLPRELRIGLDVFPPTNWIDMRCKDKLGVSGFSSGFRLILNFRSSSKSESPSALSTVILTKDEFVALP